MNNNSILIIGGMILILVLIYSIYNQADYIWRIILLVSGEIIIGVAGMYYWKTDDIRNVVISAVVVTIIVAIAFSKYGEIMGKLLLVILCCMTFFSEGKNLFSIEKAKNNTQTQENNKEDVSIAVTLPGENNDMETTKISEEEIRETKKPVLIEGYTHFYQNQFPDVYWPGGDGKSLPYNGCSVTSLTDVMVNFGVNETPESIVNYVNSLPDNYHKDNDVGGGPRWEMFYEVPEHFNLKAEIIAALEKEEVDQVRNCLKNKGMVISRQGAGEFTSQGHYIAICDYNPEDDSVVVLDPNVRNREKEERRNFRYSLNEVKESCLNWWLYYPETINL